MEKNNINYIKKFLKKDTEELIHHFSQIKFEYFRKLNDLGYDYFVNELDHAKRFPHMEKFQEETDILIKLEEYIRNLPNENFNLIKIVNLHYNLTPKEFDTCSEILQNENTKHSPLRRHMEFIISDLLELIYILNALQDLYIDYKRKFGNIAFKE